MINFTKIKILIAEDEQIIAKDISNTLIRLGYNVMGMASTGEEVVDKAKEVKPDIILMDIMLKGEMTGIDAAEQIQKDSDIPIIYLTALSDNETIQRAKITEPFGYILKPYDERMLHSAIEMGLYKHKMSSKLREKTRELEEEKKKAEHLLHNILPVDIVRELKDKGLIVPREYKSVTLMFTDFEDFTSISSNLPPAKLVSELNEIFQNFDLIIEKYNLEKLKTIGDSYMIGGGLPNEANDHAEKILNAAVEMSKYIEQRNNNKENKWRMRTGIHSGNIIAGVIGKNKFTYDVWGETVNVASRMEKNCRPGLINLSETTHELIKDKYDCKFHSACEIADGKKIDMYFLNESV